MLERRLFEAKRHCPASREKLNTIGNFFGATFTQRQFEVARRFNGDKRLMEIHGHELVRKARVEVVFSRRPYSSWSLCETTKVSTTPALTPDDLKQNQFGRFWFKRSDLAYIFIPFEKANEVCDLNVVLYRVCRYSPLRSPYRGVI
jgi:hypothetical protein